MIRLSTLISMFPVIDASAKKMFYPNNIVIRYGGSKIAKRIQTDATKYKKQQDKAAYKQTKKQDIIRVQRDASAAQDKNA